LTQEQNFFNIGTTPTKQQRYRVPAARAAANAATTVQAATAVEAATAAQAAAGTKVRHTSARRFSDERPRHAEG